MIKDTLQNTEIKYFYCNKFKWLYSLDNEQFKGHPKEKTLYRGWLNTDTKSYRILYEPYNAVFLEKLKRGPESEFSSYESDIEEVTLSNILKFNLSFEDLSNLETWIDTKNEDLKKIMAPKSQPVPIFDINQLLQSTRPSEEDVEFSHFIESADELQELNGPAFAIIGNLINHILEKVYESPEGSIDSKWLHEDSKHHTGANLAKVFERLNIYSGSNRRTNQDPKDLYEAINYLITELICKEYESI